MKGYGILEAWMEWWISPVNDKGTRETRTNSSKVRLIEEYTEWEMKVSSESRKSQKAEVQSGKATGSSKFTKFLAKNTAGKHPVDALGKIVNHEKKGRWNPH